MEIGCTGEAQSSSGAAQRRDGASPVAADIDVRDLLARYERELAAEPEERRRDFLLAILLELQWDGSLTADSRRHARRLRRRFERSAF